MTQATLPGAVLRRCQAHDLVTVDASKRVKTGDGYLYAPGHLARAGNVQTYKAGELGLDGDSNRVVRLFRPPEEVFAADAIKSFEADPITLNHPADGWVTSKNWRNLSRGEAVGIAQDGDHLAGELRVRDEEAVNAIESKEKEQLSAGYAFDFDPTPGTSPSGEAYDGIQRNIRGNHFAIVGAARGGSTCRVADTIIPPEENRMSTKTIVVDNEPRTVDEQDVGLIESLVKARDAALSDLAEVKTASNVALAEKDKTTIERAATDARTIADLKGKILTDAQLDALVEKRAAERQAVLSAADALSVKVEAAGKTAAQLRREILTAAAADADTKTVVDAALSGVAFDKATDIQVETLLSVLAAQHKGKTSTTIAQDAGVARAMGAGGTAGGDTAGLEVCRGLGDYRDNDKKATGAAQA